MQHDLFEEVDGRGSDRPGQAELAQVGADVAGQGFARFEQLTAEVTENGWRRLQVCGTKPTTGSTAGRQGWTRGNVDIWIP